VPLSGGFIAVLRVHHADSPLRARWQLRGGPV
jgi:hypothetical protein